jgi:hypothetical protein
MRRVSFCDAIPWTSSGLIDILAVESDKMGVSGR